VEALRAMLAKQPYTSSHTDRSFDSATGIVNTVLVILKGLLGK
jgi:hypothetical protein